MKRRNFLVTLFGFIIQKRAYWLLPAILLLLIFIAVIAVGTSPVAPFVYSIM